MRMTPEDILKHSRAGVCHICEKPFVGTTDSVRDHCHITGKYRGAAHNACNLKLRLNPKTTAIPVVFHNLRGYDSHLLMQAISRVQGRISCIPNNTEKYISFCLGQLRFIDSAQFLLAPLDKLVAANTPETFQITARYESTSSSSDAQRCELLLRKGVYPYEYMDSWEQFTETQLPPKASSTANLLATISAMRIMLTHKRSGRPSTATTWGTTAISTAVPTSYSWQPSLRPSGRPA